MFHISNAFSNSLAIREIYVMGKGSNYTLNLYLCKFLTLESTILVNNAMFLSL